ncbi:MAG: hypothetical protein LUI87_15100 [Lachnospiraceae bacterium]|nr:hypothetical protein [Lachnospiraceae bacterium]
MVKEKDDVMLDEESSGFQYVPLEKVLELSLPESQRRRIKGRKRKMILSEVLCDILAVIVMLFVSEDISWQPELLAVFIIILSAKSLIFWGRTSFKKGKGGVYYLGSVTFLL